MKEEMKEVKLLVPVGKKAEWVNGVLTLVKDKDARPVTERIKTFEDACEELGINPEEWMAENETYKEDADILAYLKLRIITLALNEGWKPSFAKDEYRYYPWYYLYTKEEIDAMDEKDKKRLLLVGGLSNGGSICGLTASYSSSGFSASFATLGARLAFKTSELAKYAGTQFYDTYADFCLIRKGGA